MGFGTIAERLLLSFLIIAAVVLLSSRERPGTTGGASDTGEDIFRAKCAVCHGVDGGGRTPNGKKLKVPDLRSDKVQNLPDDELFYVITNGKGYMPPIGKKYEDKLQQVVIHVRSLGKNN